jgi:ATP-dependent Zn protease
MSEAAVKAILSLMPFLFLIAVWIFFMNRMGANGGWKKAMDEQAVIQRDIARQLDRIATALEQRKP